MSHALVEYEPGKVLAFNANYSPMRLKGHNNYGWIEYRRSTDGGESWSGIYELPYSKEAFYDGVFTLSCEKAVFSKGNIILFCTRNTPYREVCCEPWLTPTYVISRDGGCTWSEPRELTAYPGRVYDAVVYDGDVYVLEFCNEAENGYFTGHRPEDVYRLFKSSDGGASFSEQSALPIDWYGRGYGSMLFRPDGSLIVYAYNINDEYTMDWTLSNDRGKTWETPDKSYVSLGIRNPQTAILGDTYILHGRGAAGKSFVFYTSSDGLEWDAGHVLEPYKTHCYYSNNIVLKDKDGVERLLIQYSELYNNYC
ncbi:MAG: sialidase family protein, partial [Eubacteriales bacterium]